MKSDVEVLGLIRGGAEVQWDRGAVLHEMPITYPVSRGGPIYQGTVASCVRECMANAPQPMVMYSMSFDAGVIAGFDAGIIMQQAIVELAKRDDFPG
jgi:hypothetical protein